MIGNSFRTNISCGQVVWNINNQYIKTNGKNIRTDIELWPSGYNFPYAICSYVDIMN